MTLEMLWYFGVASVLLLQLAKLTGVIVIGRACLLLRRAFGPRYPFGSLLGLAGVAVVSNHRWRSRVELTHVIHVERFAHRVRIGFAFFLTPILIAYLLSLHVIDWPKARRGSPVQQCSSAIATARPDSK
jgi:hypothetical protein